MFFNVVLYLTLAGVSFVGCQISHIDTTLTSNPSQIGTRTVITTGVSPVVAIGQGSPGLPFISMKDIAIKLQQISQQSAQNDRRTATTTEVSQPKSNGKAVTTIKVPQPGRLGTSVGTTTVPQPQPRMPLEAVATTEVSPPKRIGTVVTTIKEPQPNRLGSSMTTTIVTQSPRPVAAVATTEVSQPRGSRTVVTTTEVPQLQRQATEVPQPQRSTTEPHGLVTFLSLTTSEAPRPQRQTTEVSRSQRPSDVPQLHRAETAVPTTSSVGTATLTTTGPPTVVSANKTAALMALSSPMSQQPNQHPTTFLPQEHQTVSLINAAVVTTNLTSPKGQEITPQGNQPASQSRTGTLKTKNTTPKNVLVNKGNSPMASQTITTVTSTTVTPQLYSPMRQPTSTAATTLSPITHDSLGIMKQDNTQTTPVSPVSQQTSSTANAMGQTLQVNSPLSQPKNTLATALSPNTHAPLEILKQVNTETTPSPPISHQTNTIANSLTIRPQLNSTENSTAVTLKLSSPMSQPNFTLASSLSPNNHASLGILNQVNIQTTASSPVSQQTNLTANSMTLIPKLNSPTSQPTGTLTTTLSPKTLGPFGILGQVNTQRTPSSRAVIPVPNSPMSQKTTPSPKILAPFGILGQVNTQRTPSSTAVIPVPNSPMSHQTTTLSPEILAALELLKQFWKGIVLNYNTLIKKQSFTAREKVAVVAEHNDVRSDIRQVSNMNALVS
ncbi:hypothetical protein SNE40_005028 [Patella caerulea]|uniref:Uncharacterized protein n=1 Tax=Patella caerulea TaxID=87958 RepID=A0AAN8KAM7_PATCE